MKTEARALFSWPLVAVPLVAENEVGLLHAESQTQTRKGF